MCWNWNRMKSKIRNRYYNKLFTLAIGIEIGMICIVIDLFTLP